MPTAMRSPLRPERESKLKNKILYGTLVIIVLSAAFLLAGPLGIYRWLSEAIASLDPSPAAASIDGPPILLGLYTSDSLQVTSWEIENFDEWMQDEGLDKGISIAGTYMDFEFHNPEFNVHKELDAAWDLGYTPFINLTAYQQTAEQVAHDP